MAVRTRSYTRVGAAYRTGRKIVKTAVKYGKKAMNNFPMTQAAVGAALMELGRQYIVPNSPTPAMSGRSQRVIVPETPLGVGRSPVVELRGNRQRIRQRGATTSKSRGYYKKARGKKTTVDDFVKKGIVTIREQGGSVVGSAANKFQSVTIGHATCGNKSILRIFCYGLAKMFASRMGFQVENVTQILSSGARPWRIDITYKRFITDTVQTWNSSTYGLITTLADIQIDLFNWIAADTMTGNYSMYLIDAVGLWTANDGLTTIIPEFRCNLTRASVDIYCKSDLKVQNRTINASGNNESDDVDNVPIYGKYYDGTGNWIQLRGYDVSPTALAGQDFVYPDGDNQANMTAFGNLPLSTMAEPNSLSQIRRAKKSGKCRLDPGEIKTSVLTYRRKFNINHFLRTIGRFTPSENLCSIGKFRYFIYEKMIQAVSTTDVNALQVFFECNFKTGCIVTASKSLVTTQVFSTNNE